jgi:branched-chain amino acid transport system substrate-binding protein
VTKEQGVNDMAHRRPHRLIAAATLTIFAMSVASCGGDDDESDASATSASESVDATAAGGSATSGGDTSAPSEATPPTGSASSASTPADGEPIKLGIYSVVDAGAVSTSFPYVFSAARAAVASINGSGGINGRPLELVECDTRENPDDAARCARQFVDDDVAAVVGSYSIQGGLVITPVLAENGIANYGGYAQAPPDLTSENVFTMVSGAGWTGAAGPVLAARGVKSAFIAYIGVEAGATSAGFVRSGLEAAGIEVVGEVAIPPNTVDMSPFLAQAADADAEAIVSPLAETGNAQLQQTAKQQGYDFIFLNQGYSPDTARDLGSVLDGTLVPSPYPAVTDDTVKAFPALQQFVEDMSAQEATGDEFAAPQYFSPQHSVRTWVAVRTFAEFLKTLPVDSISADTILSALATAKVDQLGLTQPADFAAAAPVAKFPRVYNLNLYLNVIENGQYELGEPDPFDAAPSFG